MTAATRFECLRDVDSPEFAAAMDIYTVAFPAAERHPLDTVRQRVASGSSQLYVAQDNHQVACMALLWPFEGTPFILLDYLATAPAFRGKGLATAFMAQMRAQCAATQTYLIMEVEDPEHGDNPDERQRRYALYRHLGARQLEGISFLLPPLHGSEPTDMILMLFPDCPEGSLPGEVVRRLIIRLYAELYGRAEDDPLLGRSLKSIQPRIHLV